MFLDVGCAMLVYVLLSVLFGVSPSYWLLGIALVSSKLPDSDFLMWWWIRRKKRVTSHHFWHYPLLWLAVCALYWVVVPGFGTYLALLIVVPTMIHFLPDMTKPTGIAVGWPIVRGVYISFHNGLHVLTERERQELLEKRYGVETDMASTKAFTRRLSIDELGTNLGELVFFGLALIVTIWFFWTHQ